MDTLNLISEPNLGEGELKRLETLYLKLIKKKGKSCDESRYINFISTPAAVSDISCLPCTSDCFKLHVLRCKAQLYYWINATLPIVEELNLQEYGYSVDEKKKLRPTLMTRPPIPKSLVKPCTCKSCLNKNCVCIANGIPCCSYCKCTEFCKNLEENQS